LAERFQAVEVASSTRQCQPQRKQIYHQQSTRFPNLKQPILSYQSKPNAEAVGELTDQQPAFEKARKQEGASGSTSDLNFAILQMKAGAARQPTSVATSSKVSPA
jgi:hypothetical protein